MRTLPIAPAPLLLAIYLMLGPTAGADPPAYSQFATALYTRDVEQDPRKALSLLSELEQGADNPPILRTDLQEAIAICHHRLGNFPETVYHYQRALSGQLRNSRLNWRTADRAMLAETSLRDSIAASQCGLRYLRVGELVICIRSALAHGERKLALSIVDESLLELHECALFLKELPTLRIIPERLGEEIGSLRVILVSQGPAEAAQFFEQSNILMTYRDWHVDLDNELFTHALNLRRKICGLLGTDDLEPLAALVAEIESNIAPLLNNAEPNFREFAASIIRGVTNLKNEPDPATGRSSFFSLLASREESDSMVVAMFHLDTQLPPPYRVPVYELLHQFQTTKEQCSAGERPDFTNLESALESLPDRPFSEKDAERVRLNKLSVASAIAAVERGELIEARDILSQCSQRYLYDRL